MNTGPSKKFAVLVSSANFPRSNDRLATLRCPPFDIAGLGKILRNPAIGNFNEVIDLKDEPHHEVMLRIGEIFQAATRDDLVLIYYSGHGKLDRNGNLHLATVNTNIDVLAVTSIPVSQIRDNIGLSRCQRVILILDCCYSGAVEGAFVAKGAIEDRLQQFCSTLTNSRGTFIMTASAGEQVSMESKVGDYSVFTKHLIEGLSSGEADKNEDGLITVEELFGYIKEHMAEESAPHEPKHWALDATGALVIAHRPGGISDHELRRKIQDQLNGAKRIGVLPDVVLSKSLEVLKVPTSQFKGKQEVLYGLLAAWVEKDQKVGEFVGGFYLWLESGLAGSGLKSDVAREERWGIARAARRQVVDLIGPTYILDSKFHLLDWNPIFDEIIAKPLKLIRGRHVEDLVLAMENSRAVVERSVKVFRPPLPLVDSEELLFNSPVYGRIRFRKIAAQVSDESNNRVAWSVNLNVLSAEKEDQLWEDVARRLSREVNWSKYADKYDKLLSNFKAYRELVTNVADMIGDAKICADLAAGTGNGAVELLERGPDDRTVWAFESNEIMLEHMRVKTGYEPYANRLKILKGDLLVGLHEFEAESFDAAIMINALYAIDEPQQCLSEIYRVLKPGGVLALSTSHTGTDINALLAALGEDLKKNKLFNNLRAEYEDIYDRHRQMDSAIHRDTREKVYTYVEAAGFIIEEKVPSAYVGAVVIVKARKR